MTNKKALIFAVLLLIISFWLAVSVFITTISGGNSSPAGFGGYFLYNTFYHTAFYVPLYLLLCAFFLLRKNFNKNDIIILILTLVPFFTSGTALRIYLGAGNTAFEKFISASFGPLSPLLLLLLVVIECILIMHAAVFLKKNPGLLENPSAESIEAEEESEESSESEKNKISMIISGTASGIEDNNAHESRPESINSEKEETENTAADADYFPQLQGENDFHFEGSETIPELNNSISEDISRFPGEEENVSGEPDQIPTSTRQLPEREEYKSLSLSSVASLKGRTKNDADNMYYENSDSADSGRTLLHPDYEDDGSLRGVYNPSDYGISVPDDYRGSRKSAGIDTSEIPSDMDTDDGNMYYEPDDEMRAESSFDGVDYSEPAYFRQQKDASVSDNYKDSGTEKDDDFSMGSVTRSHYDREFPHVIMADEKDEIINNRYKTAGTEPDERAYPEYDEAEEISAYKDVNPDDSGLYEELIAEYSDEENPEIPAYGSSEEPENADFSSYKANSDISGSVSGNRELSEAVGTDEPEYTLENDSYDPLTQYNTRINADGQDRSPYKSETYTAGPAGGGHSTEASVSGALPGAAFSENADLQTDDEDDFEEEDDGQIDNTAIVKQYFESARFIKPPKKPGKYEIPVEDVLDFYQEESYDRIDARAREEADVLKRTLAEFKIEAEVTGIRKGPVITMFEILPAPGVKLSRITNLADNIALRLAASRVRIVAPIPGKHAVGIEVPNRKRAIVSFRELIEVDYSQYKKDNLPVVLGKDITGEEQIVDLTKTPHLLIAGATGSGKSVCVNSIITSILYKRAPRDVKMILIDPKIVELKLYNGIPHLLTPVITDPKKAYQALQYCVYEMERRYTLLDALSCRDIQSFNKKIKSEKIATMPLPYIMVVVDEFADLMATTGKELESTLARLAAMSRAVGIHLVLATQRPSIDVITGLIKANIPSRIAFMVASKTDSRIIIDSMGAEMLLGKGDMLFTSAWNPYPVRIQGAYLSESEVERVVEQVKEYGEPEYIDDEIFFDDDEDDYTSFEEENINDPLMNKALEIVTTAGKASASYLQRRLKIGYNRAARLVEEMERKGIVGPQNGSKPRDLLHIPDDFRE